MYWLHTDRQGSVQAVTDGTGAVVRREAVRPYAERLSEEGSHTESRGWIQQRTDDESGLTYLHARYYNPTTGLFLSPDPIGIAGGMNEYSYVFGNPVNGQDPSGLAPGGVIDFMPCPGNSCRDPIKHRDYSYDEQNHESWVGRGGQAQGSPIIPVLWKIGKGLFNIIFGGKPEFATTPKFYPGNNLVPPPPGANVPPPGYVPPNAPINGTPGTGTPGGSPGGAPPGTPPPGATSPGTPGGAPGWMPAYDAIAGGDNASPWQVGWERLTGEGPRTHAFEDGDPFTEMLKQHPHIRQVAADVCSGVLPPEGPASYRLNGRAGVPKYARDYSTLATFGQTGNLGVTYLGSYDLRYHAGSGVISFHIANSSTIESALRPPVIGYWPAWSRYIGQPLSRWFSTGMTEPTGAPSLEAALPWHTVTSDHLGVCEVKGAGRSLDAGRARRENGCCKQPGTHDDEMWRDMEQ